MKTIEKEIILGFFTPMDMFLMFTYFLKFPYGWRGLEEGMQDGKRDSCVRIFFAFKENFSALDFFLPT